MNKKIDIDYLNYTDLNVIENKIDEIITWLSTDYGITISFIPHTWVVNELPYVQEIDRIETAIEDIGLGFYKPYGWLNTTKWITSDNLYPIRSFDYEDYNRWVNNLELIDNAQGEILTLWNGISQIDWDIESEYEWEEI